MIQVRVRYELETAMGKKIVGTIIRPAEAKDTIGRVKEVGYAFVGLDAREYVSGMEPWEGWEEVL